MFILVLCASLHDHTFELGCIQDLVSVQEKTPEGPELTVSMCITMLIAISCGCIRSMVYKKSLRQSSLAHYPYFLPAAIIVRGVRLSRGSAASSLFTNS